MIRPAVSRAWGSILAALGEAVAVAVDAYQRHQAEIELARAQLAAQVKAAQERVDSKQP